MAFTLYWTPDKLSPDEIPTIIEDEVRKVTIDAASLCGTNTISGTPTATSETLTIGTVTKSGTSFSFNVTADQCGDNYVTIAAVLSNGETASAYFRVKVKQVPSSTSCCDDYQNC
jgi:hypothetical protein